MADEDQVVEGLLARAGRLPPGYRRQDGGCVAEGVDYPCPGPGIRAARHRSPGR